MIFPDGCPNPEHGNHVKNANFPAYVALTIACLLWASSFPALKFAFRAYDPMVVIFFRMLVASIALFAFSRNFRKAQYQKGDWKKILFLGICEPGFYYIFEANALTYTDASQAGMITAMLPLMVATGAHFFLKENLTRKTVTGFVVAIFGAVLLSLLAETSGSAPNPALGNFLEFMAMVCASGYMVTLKSLTARYNPWLVTMLQAMVGTLFYLPLIFLPSTAPVAGFDMVGVSSIIYLGLFVTIGGYGLYNVGTSMIPAAQASAFVNLIPVFTVIISWIVLDERLTLFQYAACGLVLAGVWYSQDRARKATA